MSDDLGVALGLGRAVFDLGAQALHPHHDGFQITAVDGDREVRIIGQEALDVGQGGVSQFDDEFLAVVRRDQVDGEVHALSLARVHADADEVQEQLGAHGADHVGAGRIDLLTLRDARSQLESGREIAVA